MEYQEHITKEEWQMFLDYEIIINAANVNLEIRHYENQTNITKLANIERGYILWFFNDKEKIIEEIRKEILSVINKLIGLKAYHKLEEQLLACSIPLASCVTSADFHKVILAVKAITTEVEKNKPRTIIKKMG